MTSPHQYLYVVKFSTFFNKETNCECADCQLQVNCPALRRGARARKFHPWVNTSERSGTQTFRYRVYKRCDNCFSFLSRNVNFQDNHRGEEGRESSLWCIQSLYKDQPASIMIARRNYKDQDTFGWTFACEEGLRPLVPSEGAYLLRVNWRAPISPQTMSTQKILSVSHKSSVRHSVHTHRFY